MSLAQTTTCSAHAYLMQHTLVTFYIHTYDILLYCYLRSVNCIPGHDAIWCIDIKVAENLPHVAMDLAVALYRHQDGQFPPKK